MRVTIWLLLLVVFGAYVGFTFGAQPDRSKWKDPTDMLHYDHSSGTMREHEHLVDIKSGPDKKNGETPPQACECPPTGAVEDSLRKSFEDLSEARSSCREQLKTADENLEECNKRISTPQQLEVRYFQRYVRMLLNYYKDVIPDGESITYSTISEFSASDIQKLREFLEGNGLNYQDVHEVLDRSILDVSQIAGYHPPTLAEQVADFVGGQLNLIYLMICCVSVVVAIWLTLQLHVFNYYMLLRTFFSLFLILFFISVPWNWWHLYQTQMATRQMSAAEGLPIECKMAGESVGWNIWFNLKSAFSISEDPCTKYYKDILVNPVLEVSPVMALSVTAIKFFVEPAEHIGRALNKLLVSSVTGLPFYMIPIMLGIVILVLFLGMVMAFGYRVRGFHLFDLQPPDRHLVAPIQEGRMEQPQILQAPVERPLAVAGDGRGAVPAVEDVPVAPAKPIIRQEEPRANLPDDNIPVLPVVKKQESKVIQPLQESSSLEPAVQHAAPACPSSLGGSANAQVIASVEEVGMRHAAGDGRTKEAIDAKLDGHDVKEGRRVDEDQTELKEVPMSASMEGFIDIQGACPLDPHDSDSDVEIIQEEIHL